MNQTPKTHSIPEHLLEGINRYVEERIPTGGFLRAVLENNLTESFGRADTESREALFEIVRYLYWEVPADCWGSPEKVKKWLYPERSENKDEMFRG